MEKDRILVWITSLLELQHKVSIVVGGVDSWSYLCHGGEKGVSIHIILFLSQFVSNASGTWSLGRSWEGVEA